MKKSFMEEFYGEVLHTHSRAQALKDGDLIDVSDVARRYGFIYPFAVTKAVWEGVVEPDLTAKKYGESANARLGDLLTVLAYKARRIGGAEVLFTVSATTEGRNKDHHLKAILGPGDNVSLTNADPVFTVMYPIEE